MTYRAGIVFRNPCDQIVGNTRVVAFPDDALKNVDIFHIRQRQVNDPIASDLGHAKP